jgi:CRISPR type III-A-associated protein Csm2
MVNIQQIIEKNDPKLLVNNAEILAKELVQLNSRKEEREASITQIRRLFSTYRQIQMTWQGNPEKAYRDLMLFCPRLAYQESRHEGLRPLTRVLQEGIPFVGNDSKRMEVLGNFFEATVAYFYAESKKRPSGGRNERR